MTFKFEFDKRGFERQLRRAAERGVRDVADQHAADTHKQVVATWNRLRRECQGMSKVEAEQRVEKEFRLVGIEFTDETERSEWTSGILANEDLDLCVDVDVRWD